MPTLKFRRLNDAAKLPTKAHPSDAGWDLYASEPAYLSAGGGRRVVALGLASEVPLGWFALVRDRSSLAAWGLAVTGGVIDAGYRGEWKVVLTNHSAAGFAIDPGDRVAQFVLLPVLPGAEVVEVSELGDGDRGGGGFGSTGR